MLPDHLLRSIAARFPCRELQIRSLAALYAESAPSPRNLVVYGPGATAKSSIVREVLCASGLRHAVVNCRECVTGRHLLERTVAAVLEALDACSDAGFDPSRYARCEHVSALAVHLQNLLEAQGTDKFVLVFDGIDRQREAPPTLLPALARFGEMIPSLSIIFITTTPRPTSYRNAHLPHLCFPSYTRSEAISILSLSPLPIYTRPLSPSIDYSDAEHREDSAWLWTRFCGVVWDSLAKAAARDLRGFRAVCEKLWRPFVSSVEDSTFGTRDFSRLLVAKRSLFQDDGVLVDKIITSNPPAAGTTVPAGAEAETRKGGEKALRDMPYYTRYLLIAAYLASFSPARQDQVFFTKAHEKKRRKKASGLGAGRVSKHRRIPRHLLNPSPFPLDRLLAILHAILPDPLPQTADLQTQVATLTSLRLLQRVGVGGDPLDAAAKWRVNCGWEFIKGVGRSVGCEVDEWVAGDV